eukprot:TRINITY_DN13815_c0_g2_i1.p1 TRINITY_DN13815_c0_g2~~TRINITY_DN13815_c0_g2_i1.p1  ORF type:complete len:314 (+),score=67.54 TRINITY_DN13815_c0_g2_i1:84-1025(+)
MLEKLHDRCYELFFNVVTEADWDETLQVFNVTGHWVDVIPYDHRILIGDDQGHGVPPPSGHHHPEAPSGHRHPETAPMDAQYDEEIFGSAPLNPQDVFNLYDHDAIPAQSMQVPHQYVSSPLSPIAAGVSGPVEGHPATPPSVGTLPPPTMQQLFHLLSTPPMTPPATQLDGQQQQEQGLHSTTTRVHIRDVLLKWIEVRDFVYGPPPPSQREERHYEGEMTYARKVMRKMLQFCYAYIRLANMCGAFYHTMDPSLRQAVREVLPDIGSRYGHTAPPGNDLEAREARDDLVLTYAPEKHPLQEYIGEEDDDDE